MMELQPYVLCILNDMHPHSTQITLDKSVLNNFQVVNNSAWSTLKSLKTKIQHAHKQNQT